MSTNISKTDLETIFNNLKKEFSEKGYSQSTLDNFVRFNIKGAELPYELKPLENYSWDEIANIIEKGFADYYFKDGDTKSATLYTGEEIVCRVIGINHDILAKTRKKQSVTFMFFVDGEFEMNELNTNIGGWTDSKMRTKYMQRFYKLLPEDLQRVIKTVVKFTSQGNKSSVICETEDKLFIPSAIEVSGECEYSADGEGEQYSFFKNGGKLPEKWFWLRSPYLSSSNSFCYWSSNGYVNYYSASSTCYCPLCFCIG